MVQKVLYLGRFVGMPKGLYRQCQNSNFEEVLSDTVGYGFVVGPLPQYTVLAFPRAVCARGGVLALAGYLSEKRNRSMFQRGSSVCQSHEACNGGWYSGETPPPH